MNNEKRDNSRSHGNIAKHVIDILVKKNDINLTLFLRNKDRLRNKDVSRCRIIEGNVLDFDQLKESITEQDIVYANLAGDLEAMSKNIVTAMEEKGLKKIIFISSIGIYDIPLRPILKSYRKAADVIEASGLEYTILRQPGLPMQMKWIMRQPGKENRKKDQ